MLDVLRSWRAEKGAECLLIKGARQVGKSYIVAEFGWQDYESFISIDFIGPPDLKRVFDGPIDADSIGSSVDWPNGAGMVRRCQSLSAAQFPLTAYEDGTKFRLYAADTGVLMAMYGFEMLEAVVNNKLAGPMKDGLYENLVACMLSARGVALRYWRSQKGDREIEFLVDSPDASVVPIEVKASRGSTVSLNDMLERQDVNLGYKLIDGNVGRDGKKVTLPLYMAMFLK